VEDSILLTNARTGRYSRIRRAIIGENVVIPDSSVIGYDAEADLARGYHVTESGLVVVAEQPQPALVHRV
ncbi:MAG: glucose-1-phosphate adenylyltransferase, partial [Bryobacteraceae bacterium]